MLATIYCEEQAEAPSVEAALQENSRCPRENDESIHKHGETFIWRDEPSREDAEKQPSAMFFPSKVTL